MFENILSRTHETFNKKKNKQNNHQVLDYKADSDKYPRMWCYWDEETEISDSLSNFPQNIQLVK